MYCNNDGNRTGGRIFSGLLFLAAGLLLLVANFNMIELRPILSRWWPLILVIMGVKHLVQWGSGAWLNASFWVGSGLLFLASSLGYINVSFGSLIWPVVLIWFGVAMAVGRPGCSGAPTPGGR